MSSQDKYIDEELEIAKAKRDSILQMKLFENIGSGKICIDGNPSVNQLNSVIDENMLE